MMKRERVIDTEAQPFCTGGKALQGLLPKLAGLQTIQVHADCRQQRQAADTGEVEKLIEMTGWPVHLLPGF